jgi:uncharacterized cupin superfamily protein
MADRPPFVNASRAAIREILQAARLASGSPASKVTQHAGGALTVPTREFQSMKKVNTNTISELTWSSPKGKFAGAGKQVSEELGRNPKSMDLLERHPFDIEILRVAPGKTPYPYHSHSAQWEFYHVISGKGSARHKEGSTPIEPGDAFLFKPGEPHQIINDGTEDLVIYVVADNPIGEAWYYPDSNKWGVPIPERRTIRSEKLDYFDGEE